MDGKPMGKRGRVISTSGGSPPSKKSKTAKAPKPDIQPFSNQSPLSSPPSHVETPNTVSAWVDTLRPKRSTQNLKAATRYEPTPSPESTDHESDDPTYIPRASGRAKQEATRKQYEKLFKISDKHMDLFWALLKIPIYLPNPPEPCKQDHKHDTRCPGSKTSKVSASHITKELMEFFGKWEFVDATMLTQPEEQSRNTPENIYGKDATEVEAKRFQAGGVPLEDPPFKMPKPQDGIYHLKADEKSDRNVREAWWWTMEHLHEDDKLIPKFALEWTEIDISAGRIRPELPAAFERLLIKRQPVPIIPPSPSSSFDFVPAKRGRAQLDGSCLASVQEDVGPFSVLSAKVGDKGATQSEYQVETQPPASAASPVTSLSCNLDTSGDADSVIPTISHADPLETHAAPPPSTAPENCNIAQPVSVPSMMKPEFKLAYSFAQNNNLQETEADARRLAQYVKEQQRMFDINHSKNTLCILFPPRRENVVLDGNIDGLEYAYMPKADIEALDRRERGGNATKTEDALDASDTAVALNIRWLTFFGIESKSVDGVAPVSELTVERKVGGLFSGLFKFDGLQELADTTIKFPVHFQLFSTSPRPDIAVRPAPGAWSHLPAILCPVLMSADAKRDDEGDYAPQLAFNNHPVLILLILMYLDIRPTAETPLPGWMFTYGLIYSDRGFLVYIHYPKGKLEKNGNWSWKMVSVKLTSRYADVWLAEFSTPLKRLRVKAAVDRMVSHTSFVHERIRKWSLSRCQYGSGSIMDQLIARAHYEANNHRWLHEEAQKLTKKSAA